ncbi:MAG: hypothetical protein GJ680_06575 [Alteromonadaceae bacterium]|nr:hypothetical protein [Alteromonadaceae bacterium]
MNLGDVKSVLTDKAPLEQAQKDKASSVALQQSQTVKESSAIHVSLSAGEQRTLASARILQSTFGQNVTINNQRLLESLPKQNEEKPLFDFEEVAKNVLQFVGGAIKSAQANGAEDEELLAMFEQARDGVLKGVEQARKDLAGFMNEEIDEGITNSLNAIKKGIEDLEREVFGQSEEDEQVNTVTASQAVSTSSEKSGEITITTQDGDEVTISFENVQQIEASQTLAIETNPTDDATTQEQSATEVELENQEAQTSESDSSVSLSQSYSSFNSEELAFTVEGEIDEQERAAIQQLVRDTSTLIDDFFSGDVEAAFQKALELGFDEEQIAEYSVELSKTETVEVVQTYEQVSNYVESDQEKQEFPSPFKKIADYVDNLVKVIDESSETLADNASFDKLINGLMNRVLDINTDDLVAAINRFNTFNGRFDAEKPFPSQETA